MILPKLNNSQIFLPLIISFSLIVSLFLFVKFASAQNFSLSIAKSLKIDVENVEEGSIISFVDGRYRLSNTPYDNSIVGVVTYSPAIQITTENSENTYPVVDTGVAFVRVSGMNGNLGAGDVITTSSIEGVGTKLIQDGFGLGISKNSVEFNSEEEIKIVEVDLQLKYYYSSQASNVETTSSILDQFNISSLKEYDTIAEVLRLFIAGVLALCSFIYGFLTLRKIALHGISATGRNPLASRSIMFNLIINLLVTLFAIICGLVLSYLVLSI